MGAKVGKSAKRLAQKEEERLDILQDRAILEIHHKVTEITVLGSHNRVTIHPNSHSSLHSLTLEGVNNVVRLERSTGLIDILGSDNSVTVAKNVIVRRMRIQGKDVRWTGKKDLDDRGTEDEESREV